MSWTTLLKFKIINAVVWRLSSYNYSLPYAKIEQKHAKIKFYNWSIILKLFCSYSYFPYDAQSVFCRCESLSLIAGLLALPILTLYIFFFHLKYFSLLMNNWSIVSDHVDDAEMMALAACWPHINRFFEGFKAASWAPFERTTLGDPPKDWKS